MSVICIFSLHFWGFFCKEEFSACKNCIFVILQFAIKSHRLITVNHQRKSNSSITMGKYLTILETLQQQQQEIFDEEKVKFINSKISIWDYFGNPQATYLSYTGEEKSKMFREYYNKLVDTYYGTGNLFLFVFARVWLISLVRVSVLSLMSFLVFF